MKIKLKQAYEQEKTGNWMIWIKDKQTKILVQ